MSVLQKRIAWQDKVVYFHLRAGTGLDGTLDTSKDEGKIIRMFHAVMRVPVTMFLVLEISGMVVCLTSAQVSLQKMVLYFVFALLMVANFVAYHLLLLRQSMLVTCLQNVSDRHLYCLAGRSKEFLWLRHKSTGVFLVLLAVFMYSLALFTAVVSPALRFGLDFEEWFIVIPVWYPIDVTSSRRIFWFVLVWESTILWYNSLMFATAGVLYIYILMDTRSKFEALSQYLQDDERPQFSQPQTFFKYLKTSEGRKSEPMSVPISLFGDRFCNDVDRKCGVMKQCIKDWQKLRRHAKLISEYFVEYFSAVYLVGMITNTIMAYAVVYTLRHTVLMGKIISETAMYVAYVSGASGHIYLMCLNATLFEITYDDLKHSLWKNNWYEKSIEYREIFLNFSSALNNSVKMKAFSFVSVDLERFSQVMNRSFSYFLFLYELPVAK